MRKIAGPLRLNLAQFRELARLRRVRFGARRHLAGPAGAGRRVVEVLKQPQFAPVPVEEQVVSIYAVTEGHMDYIAIADCPPLRGRVARVLPKPLPGLLSEIRDTGQAPG